MTKMVTAKVEQYTGSTIFSTFCRSHDYIILDRNDGEKNTKTMKKFVENAKDSLLRNNLFINVSQQCNPLIYPDGLVLHKQQLSSTCMPFFAHLSHRCICFTTNMVYQNFASISGLFVQKWIKHTHVQPSTDGNCSHTNIFGRSFPKHQFHTKVQRTGDIIRIQLHLAVADVVVWSSTKYAINMRWELLRVFTMRFRENSLNGISLCSMNLRNFMFMFQKCHSMKRRTSNWLSFQQW